MMTGLARRFVTVMQNAMLGDLFGRLIWVVLYVQGFVAGAGASTLQFRIFEIAFACVILILVLAWTIGFMSIREKPKGRWPLERIHDASRDGFEVWTRTPADGPRPPPLMRAIIMTLGCKGYRGVGWLRVLLVIFVLAVFGVSLLRQFDRTMLASVSPMLVQPRFYTGLFLAVLAALIVGAVRGWAVDSRKRLEGVCDGGADLRGSGVLTA